jgi:hypothetical protein
MRMQLLSLDSQEAVPKQPAACVAQPSLDRPAMPPQSASGFRRLVE